ncbi:MAG: hypothetical protein WDN49_18440 [Acetobacteraceae bacterium]
MPQLQLASPATSARRARRKRAGRRLAQRLVGGVLIGAWVMMPLMPLAAILLSWLNGLS